MDRPLRYESSGRYILVTGDRDYEGHMSMEVILLGESLLNGKPYPTFVHGGCRMKKYPKRPDKSADAICDWVCHELGFPVIAMPAHWETGLHAGLERNTAMLETYRPIKVLAFHDHFADSRGTKDCVEKALERGIPVTLYENGNRRELHQLDLFKDV